MFSLILKWKKSFCTHNWVPGDHKWDQKMFRSLSALLGALKEWLFLFYFCENSEEIRGANMHRGQQFTKWKTLLIYPYLTTSCVSLINGTLFCKNYHQKPPFSEKNTLLGTNQIQFLFLQIYFCLNENKCSQRP